MLFIVAYYNFCEKYNCSCQCESYILPLTSSFPAVVSITSECRAISISKSVLMTPPLLDASTTTRLQRTDRALSHGATTITWISISTRPKSQWLATGGRGSPLSHPKTGSEEAGLIQVPWGPDPLSYYKFCDNPSISLSLSLSLYSGFSELDHWPSCVFLLLAVSASFQMFRSGSWFSRRYGLYSHLSLSFCTCCLCQFFPCSFLLPELCCPCSAVCLLVYKFIERNKKQSQIPYVYVFVCLGNKADSDRTQSCFKCFKYGCRCKEAANSKTWMLHTHLQPGSTEDLYNHHSFKVNTKY